VACRPGHSELHYGSPDFMPTRLTVDLFRSARQCSDRRDVRAVRDGRRVRSAECELAQEGPRWSHGAPCCSPTVDAAPGRVWSVPTTIPFHRGWTMGLAGGGRRDAGDWESLTGDHQNDSRKRFYKQPSIDVSLNKPTRRSFGR